MIKSKKNIIVAALLAIFTLGASAVEIIKPDIGEPLRNAAVTRGPVGKYYLTGTRATGEYEGKPDFNSNDGVKLWSSSDLKTWKDEGFVINLTTRRGWRDDPLLQFYFLPERPLAAKYTRALTTPRLAFIGGDLFVSFSMLGHDMRWMRAKKPSGPWKDGRLEKNGKPYTTSNGPGSLRHVNGPGNGVLFEAPDGSAYMLWGPGYIARLNDKRDNIVKGSEEVLLTRVAGYPNGSWCVEQFDPHAFTLHFHKGKYILTWAAYTDTAGYKRHDSFYAVADKVKGPYSEPERLIPGSGPVSLFDAGERGLMASCSIADAPVFVPLSFANSELVAEIIPPSPTAVKAARAGKLAMFDYANSRPSGKRAQRAGDELKYELYPVFADKPSTKTERIGRHKLVPLFDLPLADVAICRGKDAWYLTGTAADKRQKSPRTLDTRHPTPDTVHDFQNNDGIYLWKSSDFDTWEPLGKIWDIEKDGSAWAKQYRIPGDNPVRDDFCRGVTAPEIHYFNDTYWIAYSMNGRGTGLLKSKSGNPEGPYADMGRITGMGESPSIFRDSDGKIRWLWGKGLQIAELSLDRKELTSATKDLLLSFVAFPPGGWDALRRSHWWNVTAPFMFTAIDPKTKNKVYALSFSAITQTFQRANKDTLVAIAPELNGAFQAALRMIPNGGQTTVFPGPGGELFASFSGADPSAVFRDRPAILPMEWYRLDRLNWPRMVQGDFYTSRGPWTELMPPKGVPGTRDINVFKDVDGYYYYSGSGVGGKPWEGGAHFWRAKDITGPWEDIGFLYTMEEMRDDPNWPEIKSKNDLTWNNAKFAWEPNITRSKGTYWMSLWFGGHGWGKEVCWKKHCSPLLKSTNGKITGPYVLHSNQWPTDFQGIWRDDDGTAYGCSGKGAIWKMNDDFTASDPEWKDLDGSKLKSYLGLGVKLIDKMADGRFFSEDCGNTLYKIGGKYVSGGLTHHCGYDGLFSWADDLRGPWHYMGVVPNLGNAPVVQNRDGKWLTMPQCGNTALFATPYRQTDKTIPTDLFLYEVVFDMDKAEPSVWPKHDLGHLEEAVYQP